VLGLFGSDHPAIAAQLSACQVHWAEFSGPREEIRAIERRLAETGVALVSPGLSAGVSRDAAARRIGEILGSVASSLPPPGTVIVAGGETLKQLCSALGTDSLLATAQVAPGLPLSLDAGRRLGWSRDRFQVRRVRAPDALARPFDRERSDV
jgi:uncharacterized protein YgbK (DUF1537 family)